MKYVFFGTPEFAAIILEKLVKARILPSVVIANPDKPVGRKKIITPPPVKQLTAKSKAQIEILQPEKIDNYLITKLLSYNLDFFVIAAYSKILPKEILDIPKLGVIGVHPSLLPKYRGPTPIQTAILNGEKETGVTLFLTDEKIDHGPILTKRKLQISNSDNYEILMEKLAELGADLLIETLPTFMNGKTKPEPQNESEATYSKKFKTEDAFVNLEKDNPIIIERKIRALNPEPGVWTIWQNEKPFGTAQGKRVKLLEAELIQKKSRRPDGIGAPTETSELKLKKIQVEGKKPTTI